MKREAEKIHSSWLRGWAEKSISLLKASPHLSPDAERGLLTPFPFREGARGLGLRDFGVNNNTFRHPL